MENNRNHDDIILDEEFQRLLPPLEEKVFADLEESLLLHGVRDSLVLWNNILIDGYNRFAISQKHGLPFNTVSMEFPSRDEVIIWIIKNQFERRNLTPMQARRLRGVRYNAEKRIQGTKNQFVQKSEKSQNETFHSSTAVKLANEYNVSRNTILRDAQVANALDAIGSISPDIKVDILTGKTRISNKQLQELSTANTEDIKAIITQIEEGTFESRKTNSSKNINNNAHNDISTPTMQPWEIQFTKMTEEFRQMIRTQSKPEDTVVVKTALRQYIKMLEDLYQGI